MKNLALPAGAFAALALPAAIAAAAGEQSPAPALLPDVVVTAPATSAPLVVETDPRAPRQPVPAHDGADYLKAIPGFSVIRKGGTDGDPVFRGMAGSRLNVLLDGEQVLGGCGMRMDPPTAYVFPEAYDRITVLKGPQTVLHGPGNSAGTVLFERDEARRTAAGWEGHASATAGSFDRNDQVVDLRGGNSDVQARLAGTRSHANDYEDGDGVRVHSQYERWSGDAALAWTPADDTRVELSYGESDGEAAYGDRGMDGSLFARDNVGIKASQANISDLVRKVEVQAFRAYIDHVMDNYTLRAFTPSMMMPAPAASNPDRLTTGVRAAVELAPADSARVTLGVDQQANEHTVRSSMNALVMPYQAMARTDDAAFRNHGVFGEYLQAFGDDNRVITGLRADRWLAQDRRMMPATAGDSRSDTLESGFLRHEHDIAEGSTVYVGLGHAQRFPDYWELFGQGRESLTTNSAFLTRPEQTTQLDAGWVLERGRTSFSVAVFAADIHDYILVDNVIKPAPMPMPGAMPMAPSVTRNVDATTLGGEAGAGYALTDTWSIDGSLAWVRGDNETDSRPLAQLPPPEARVGLGWDNGTWAAGGLLRMVDRQHRVDPGKGNIAGQDIGATPGYAVFSLNGAWRAGKGVLVAAGVDNLLDTTYAEHLSRAGAMVAGFPQATRVNEPGRNLWLRASMDF